MEREMCTDGIVLKKRYYFYFDKKTSLDEAYIVITRKPLSVINPGVGPNSEFIKNCFFGRLHLKSIRTVLFYFHKVNPNCKIKTLPFSDIILDEIDWKTNWT